MLGAIATVATADPEVEISAADHRENRPAVQVCPQLNLTEAIQTSVSNFRAIGSLYIIYMSVEEGRVAPLDARAYAKAPSFFI
ncbi:hypothetical protein OSCI_2680003 [Kamptonema sp. PCC 6506]|nr:hypothetical protein OSCI_2680003 [Kamptonema sp. PCC 6506]